MNLITNPDKSQWAELLKRPVMNTENLFDTVRSIIDRVKAEGDRAVLEYEEKFDKVALTALAVTEAEQAEAEALVGEELKKAIRLAKRNIETFHAAQRFESKRVETQPGVTCWQKAVAIEKVGLYIPGGTAPLFSTVLMLAVPARIAGCKEIVLCTPPGKDGKAMASEAINRKNEYINPVIRITVTSHGMLFLLPRPQCSILEKGKTDILMENYLLYGETLEQGAERILQEILPSAPPQNLHFCFMYQKFKGGKLCTFQQIEHNLHRNFFSSCFEREYEHTKEIIYTREKYKEF